MAENRKADVFARPESFLDKLKRRRQAYESGSLEEIQEVSKVFEGKKKKKKSDY